jgi:kynurenine formamidase
MALAQESLTFDPLFERNGTQVSRSPWGPDDEIGRLNWMTQETQQAILRSLDGRQVFDLAVEYFVGMPSWTAAGDPPYQIWMTHTPTGTVHDDATTLGVDVNEKNSYCGDSVHLYTHTGTHLDTLNHFGFYGRFWNGWTADTHLGSRHWTVGGPDKYPPLIARSVLLDIAGLHGVDCLPDSYATTASDIMNAAREQQVELRRGDIVCLRFGRQSRWPDPERYIANNPGLSLAGARYLCEEAGAMIIGCDTVSIDAIPSEEPDQFVPVHCYLFATAGAQIIEVLRLDELAAERQYEFAFMAFPIKLVGATGVPVRPVAVPLRS